jgi:small subunit ribosomal protein S6
MRRYETIVIVHPSLSQEDRQPFFDKLTNLIPEPQGLLIKFDQWGQRRLAYEIKKQTRGFYVLAEYCGDGALVKELERNLRLDDRALKYMTVCIDQEVNLEKVKAEVEAAKQAATEAAQKAATEAAEREAAKAAQEAATETEQEATPPAADQEVPSETVDEKPTEAALASEDTPQPTEEEPANGNV